MRRHWLLLLGLVLLAVAAHSDDEVHPTPASVHFWGQASTLDGQPLPADAVVRAYDPSGVLAGCYDPAGQLTGCNDTGPEGGYAMPVYGDDHGPASEVDEGADPGDEIFFTVNGLPAVPMGPDAPIWTGDTATPVHVELRACTLAGDFDCDCRVTVADVLRQARSFGVARGEAGYYPPLDRAGADDTIDVQDLQQTASEWGDACQS